MATSASVVKETILDRRSQVMIGDLPPDFLCIPQTLTAQIASDHQLAASLQYQQANGVPVPCTPPSALPRLSITLVQAKLAKNYGITRMDPYCRVRVGHSVFETQSDFRGSRNPRWNKTVYCYLPSGIDTMYVEIFNEGTFTMDKLIAWVHIKITEKVLQGGASDDWYILNGQLGEGKEGMVNLVLSYSEAPVPMPSNQPNLIYSIPPQHSSYQPYAVPVMQPPVGSNVIVGPPQVTVQQPNHQVNPPLNYAQMNGMQPPPQQGPLFTKEDVEQVKEMFPDVDEEVIQSVFESNLGDKDATINGLLELSQH